MVAMPEKPTYSPDQLLVLLQAWWQDQQQLATLKTREVLRRKEVADLYFTEPKEGVNRVDIGGGFDLKMEHKFNRSVDEQVLDSLTSKLRKSKVEVDELFTYKPTLSISAYRKLTDEQRQLVDECLVIDVGTPALSIVPQSQPDKLGTQPFDAVPAPPVAEPAPAPAPVSYVPGPLMDGLTREDFYAQGWTDEQLIEHGYLLPQMPEGPDPVAAPKKKRGRPAGKKAKGE